MSQLSSLRVVAAPAGSVSINNSSHTFFMRVSSFEPASVMKSLVVVQSSPTSNLGPNDSVRGRRVLALFRGGRAAVAEARRVHVDGVASLGSHGGDHPVGARVGVFVAVVEI